MEVLEIDKEFNEKLKEGEDYKNSGNNLFRETHYEKAVESYSKAIECVGKTHKIAAIYFSNKAQCEIFLERYGIAVSDSLLAIEADPYYIKAYYRLAVGYTNLGKLKEAIEALENLQKRIESPDSEISNKLRSLRQLKKERDFFGSFQYNYGEETIDENSLVVEQSYCGPIVEENSIFDKEWIQELVFYLRDQKKVHKKYLWIILKKVKDILKKERNINTISIEGQIEQVTVCGDIHGQFYDLLNIFEKNGFPTKNKPYVFNGDFVDRGSFSVEVIILLFALKISDAGSIFLNRGNHENVDMNKTYGFEGEVCHKYCSKTFSIFTSVFNILPLAVLISKKILVLHGGLFQEENVKLDDIQKINRNGFIPSGGLMCDALWSDPSNELGRKPNMRGISIEFGADVTKKFLQENDLNLLVRSHQVKEEGYEMMHNNQVITIFSAPKYCDSMTNKGAYIIFKTDLKPDIVQFQAVPHPNIPAMAYARGANMLR